MSQLQIQKTLDGKDIVLMSDSEWKKQTEEIRISPLNEKIEKSLSLLRMIIEKKDSDIPLIINFSGGKDSLVCLSLALKVSKNVECCYADGGFDLPQTLGYIKERCNEFNVKLHTPKAGDIKLPHKENSKLSQCQTLRDFVLHYGYFPTAGRRWCSTWFKHRLMKVYWRSLYGKKKVLYKIAGVRMFESRVRLWKYGNPKHYQKHIVDNNKFIRYDREHSPCKIVYPILEWTTEDVKEYLGKENITIHDGYKLYGVSGCKWCPVHTPDIYKKILTRFPELYDDIIEIETLVNRPCVQNKFFLRDIKEEVLKEKGVENEMS